MVKRGCGVRFGFTHGASVRRRLFAFWARRAITRTEELS